MTKNDLIKEMLTEKGDKNNTIDLDAYARGLIDMYDRLFGNQFNLSDLVMFGYFVRKNPDLPMRKVYMKWLEEKDNG